MYIFIIIIGIIIDRVTKLLAISKLNGEESIAIIKNFFSFEYVENEGAAFGILQGRQYILSAMAAIMVIAIIFYLIKYKPSSKLLKLSLSMVISGAIGNLIDRLYYNYVVDFISFHYKDLYYFPNFNVADILVVVGTFLLVFYIIKDVKE
ncbi:MAG: signal peptidase II [Clostridiales bacterium]|mgnify:CR=1 FL=1|uniref:signal peptidase II n=1 Tax=Clostridium sp. N3C TaxID=1776758 RepID=UPI00092E1894|nr:signal peptidase II [Clostridium sp. N3C]NLZ47341.1 signal peptidase II [Clostridiales bacterium]SCN21355.1 Lipoprotein signal peptidase [Clostridium sp. N3C]